MLHTTRHTLTHLEEWRVHVETNTNNVQRKQVPGVCKCAMCTEQRVARLVS